MRARDAPAAPQAPNAAESVTSCLGNKAGVQTSLHVFGLPPSSPTATCRTNSQFQASVPHRQPQRSPPVYATSRSTKGESFQQGRFPLVLFGTMLSNQFRPHPTHNRSPKPHKQVNLLPNRGHRSATELSDFTNSGVLTSVTDHSKAVSRLPRPERVAQ